MTSMGDLLGPEPVLLPGDPAAEAELAAAENPAIVAAALRAYLDDQRPKRRKHGD